MNTRNITRLALYIISATSVLFSIRFRVFRRCSRRQVGVTMFGNFFDILVLPHVSGGTARVSKIVIISSVGTLLVYLTTIRK